MTGRAPLRNPTPGEIDAFTRNGCVVLTSVLSPAWLSALDQACARLLAAPDALDITEETLRLTLPASAVDLFGAPTYAKALVGRGRFRMHFNAAEREPAVREFALRGAVGAIAAALMRSTTARFVDDILFVKEPHTEEATEWHDDDAGSVTMGRQRCSLWVALGDVPEDAGPLWFLRGSHRRFAGWRERGWDAHALATAHTSDVVTCPVRVGDVVAHHLATIHAAGPNRSALPRRAWALRFAGEESRFVLRSARGEPRERYGLADGEPLAGSCFPLAWPPAGGSAHEVSRRHGPVS